MAKTKTQVKVTFGEDSMYNKNEFPFQEYKAPDFSDYMAALSSVMDQMPEKEKEEAFQYTAKVNKSDYSFSDDHYYAGTVRF